MGGAARGPGSGGLVLPPFCYTDPAGRAQVGPDRAFRRRPDQERAGLEPGDGELRPACGARPRFNRFCSADLPALSAFYDAASGKGFNGRLFMNGEEAGSEGARSRTGLDGTSWELPRLGKLSFENVVANPATRTPWSPKPANSTPGKVYFYLGAKTSSGTAVERAGLTNGTPLWLEGGQHRHRGQRHRHRLRNAFTLVDLGNLEGKTGAELDVQSTAAGGRASTARGQRLGSRHLQREPVRRLHQHVRRIADRRARSQDRCC